MGSKCSQKNRDPGPADPGTRILVIFLMIFGVFHPKNVRAVFPIGLKDTYMFFAPRNSNLGQNDKKGRDPIPHFWHFLDDSGVFQS